MKIDIFNHFFPKRYFEQFIDTGGIRDIGKRVRNIQAIHDLDFRFKVADEFGEGYTQFLTLPAPPIEAIAGPDKSPEVAQIGNDGLAELCRKYPDRFVGFAATLPLNNVDASIVEAKRAVNELGALGVEVFTNIKGTPLDHETLKPFWDEIAKLDRPVWMHPTRTPNLPD